MKIKLEIEVDVTNEDIQEIIEMAGYGICYWCDEAKDLGDSYAIHDIEDDEWVLIKYEDIVNGVRLYVKNGNCLYNILEIEDGRFVIDRSQIDTEVADMIIQYAYFGDIVYG